jgi:hypothetical protein
LIYETFSKQGYEEHFPGITDPSKKDHLHDLFQKAFISVVTRCFGWGVPKTSMIPFADSINHHNVDSTYEMLHLKYHQNVLNSEKELGPEQYYTQTKVEGDYDDLFRDKGILPDGNEGEELKSKERPILRRTEN